MRIIFELNEEGEHDVQGLHEIVVPAERYDTAFGLPRVYCLTKSAWPSDGLAAVERFANKHEAQAIKSRNCFSRIRKDSKRTLFP